MNAKINYPCSENWDKMKVGLRSRFCEKCEKQVVDFTKMDRKEILKYLLKNRGQQTCGRIFPSQLDFSDHDMMLTINTMVKESKNSNFFFYLLTMSALLLVVSSAEAQTSERDTLKVKTELTTAGCDSLKKNVNDEVIIEHVLQGDVAISPEFQYLPDPVGVSKNDGVHLFADKMPEFKGGMDSLRKYIEENLTYPKGHTVRGTMYVSFVIDTTGKVLDPKILRGIHNADELDKEVLRVIREMPDWIPGENNGKKVKVRFNLPIRINP